MLIMVSHASQDATVVGRRLRRRVLLALCLSGLLPVLVLAYAVLRYLFADVGSLRGVHLIGLQGLVFFTLLAMVGGAWIIWDIGRAVSRMGDLLSPQPNATAPGARTDEVGHAVGDETLREIAQILMKQSRGINVVSRYGGDEFAILLVETSKAGARLYADRIRQVVATCPFSHGKPVTASFGVASLPDDEATNSEDLFRAADEALYAAKRAGKNQVAAAGPAEKVTSHGASGHPDC